MMGRKADLPDHANRSHDTRWPISDKECEHLKEKYGFQSKDSDFCYELNFALSWIDIYKESEERPINENIKLLEQIHICAKQLKELLKKEKAEYFYRDQPVINGIKGLLSVLGVGRYGLSGRVFMQCLSASDRRDEKNELNRKYRIKKEWSVLESDWKKRQAEINQQARESNRTPDILKSPKEKWECLNAMNIPPDTLCRSVRSSTERLFTAIDYIGHEKIEIISDHGKGFPKEAELLSALNWLADASGKAADELKVIPYLDESGKPNREKTKPRTMYHRKLLNGLWHFFIQANPEKNDRITWDAYQEKYTGTFFEFTKEVFPLAAIHMADTSLAGLIIGLNKNEK